MKNCVTLILFGLFFFLLACNVMKKVTDVNILKQMKAFLLMEKGGHAGRERKQDA